MWNQRMNLVSSRDMERFVEFMENYYSETEYIRSVSFCSDKMIVLKSRPQRVITPLDGTHRAVVMALERGKLQNLIFDNRLLWNHRALAAVLGVILKFPPLKKVLVSRQLKSRYLEALLSRIDV